MAVQAGASEEGTISREVVCLWASIRLDRWTDWSSHGLTSSLNLAPEEKMSSDGGNPRGDLHEGFVAGSRISVQNVANFLVRLKDWMLLGQIGPATLVVLPNTGEETEGKVSIDRFYLKNT